MSRTDWRARAAALDAADELAAFRARFDLPAGVIYLDGNSLGLPDRAGVAALRQMLDEWGARGIGGWLEAAPPWYTLPETLAAQMAPLVGAAADEVIVANSTTVNLHQLLATLYRPRGARGVLLMDEYSFPSNHHAVASQLAMRGLEVDHHLRRVPGSPALQLDEDALISAMTPEVHTVLLPSVLYHSGQLLDLPRLTAAAHDAGCLIGFDCSHSVGVVPHAFDEWGVDFAWWCTYKYLCGGPGSSGALYVNRRHFDAAPGLAGWFGGRKESMFAMRATFDRAPGATGLQIGTPTVFGMAPLLGSLETIAAAGIERIRAKSLALTALLMDLIDERLAPYGASVANPRPAERRGGHIALAHPAAGRLCRALRARGVVPDFRPPRIVRLAPAPLYTSFTDCVAAVERIEEVLADGAHGAAGDPEIIP